MWYSRRCSDSSAVKISVPALPLCLSEVPAHQGLAQRMLGEENVLRRWNPGKHTLSARRNTVHTNSSSDTPLKHPRM